MNIDYLEFALHVLMLCCRRFRRCVAELMRQMYWLTAVPQTAAHELLYLPYLWSLLKFMFLSRDALSCLILCHPFLLLWYSHPLPHFSFSWLNTIFHLFSLIQPGMIGVRPCERAGSRQKPWSTPLSLEAKRARISLELRQHSVVKLSKEKWQMSLLCARGTGDDHPACTWAVFSLVARIPGHMILGKLEID